MTHEITAENTYAAIDLGSNSFHMAVANTTASHLQMIDKVREPVRLGSGLDKHHNIDAATMQRALDCLAIFQQRLRGVPRDQIRAVGTNTLRRAHNASAISDAAEDMLGVPVEVISGREEARLIFSGVTYGVADNKKRLVIDIGGGSTEFIAGSGIEPAVMESVNMGCVTANQRWFNNDNKLSQQFEKAIRRSQQELSPLTKSYLHHSWDNCIGASGTIKATERILIECGLIESGITRKALENLVEKIQKKGVALLKDLSSISDDRRAVILGGISVLLAAFRTLDIKTMAVSHRALREGVIVDLAGESTQTHVRNNAVQEMQRRFQIDNDQAIRVNRTAQHLFDQVRRAWNLDRRRDRATLRCACLLHEIGLSVSHAQYHKHGEYLLKHADMLGFSRNEQSMLAALVRNHRRKVVDTVCSAMNSNERNRYKSLLTLLRLSTLFHRTRGNSAVPPMTVSADSNKLALGIDNDWLAANPLTAADLQDEIKQLSTLDMALEVG